MYNITLRLENTFGITSSKASVRVYQNSVAFVKQLRLKNDSTNSCLIQTESLTDSQLTGFYRTPAMRLYWVLAEYMFRNTFTE